MTEHAERLRHQLVGSGPVKIIVLNDWLSDTSSWDAARPYLDLARSTWAFVDLRGYGRSKAISGAYTVEEAAADVVAVADSCDWRRFAIVGHSMSTLVALHLAQHRPDRVERAVALAPVPPGGLGVGDEVLGFLQGMAHGDNAQRIEGLRATWGTRVTEQWLRFKAERWRAVSEPHAVAAYARMFARDGLPNPTAPIHVPLLAVAGEHDAEPMRRDAITSVLSPLCAQLRVTPLFDCGHYPMQEAPPYVVSLVERFLADEA
jgi:pimeloyl-ACP methyl ester carboxylesterase